MKKEMKKSGIVMSTLLAIVLSAMLTACGSKGAAVAEAPVAVEEAAGVTEIGEGAVQFTFEVVDADGNTTVFLVNTDAATVGEALLGNDLIAGEDSDYGLYVKTVNGITADYDVDQTYWAFYVDGEYASTGVDSTDVVAGSTYSFKVEK